jgi:hypothetical protein
VEGNAREAIAVWLDAGIASFDLDVEYKTPDAVRTDWDYARKLLHEAVAL